MDYEKEFTWDQIAKIIYVKITTRINRIVDFDDFYSWFMKREKVGIRFGYKLIYKCYEINQKQKREQDYFILCTGKEGTGKSTLAHQLACWINPEYDLSNTVISKDEYLEKIKPILENHSINNKDSQKVIVIDEGSIALFSRNTMSKDNVNLIKFFQQQRFLNICVIICIPSFYGIDNDVRSRRADFLIHKYKKHKGNFRAINREGMDLLVDPKITKKNIMLTKLHSNTYFDGKHQKDWPNSLNYLDYYNKKKKHAEITLNNLETTVQKQEDPELLDMLYVKDVRNYLGYKRDDSIINLIKKGKLKAKKILKHWRISRASFEEFKNSIL